MTGRGQDIIEPLESESLGGLASRLLGNAEDIVRAEVRLQKLQLFAKLTAVKGVAIYAVAALATLHLALIGLVVALLLILQRPLGPIWASVIVVGGFFLLAALLGLLAWSAVKRMTKAPA